MDDRQIPPKILTSFIRKPRCSGRRYRTTRDGIYSNLQSLFPEIPSTGNLRSWRKYAFHEGYWGKCLEALVAGEEVPIFNETDWNRNSTRNSSNGSSRPEDNSRGRTYESPDGQQNARRNNNSAQHNCGDGNGETSRNNQSSRGNQQQYTMSTETPDPSYFASMSHIHTLHSARKCLLVHPNHSIREVTICYKRLARKYHPDKRHQNIGCSKTECTRIFQCIVPRR